MLTREDGIRCNTQEQIMSEIREFYIDLMGSAASELPMVDKEVVNRGPKLNADVKTMLCENCTNTEVRKALCSMDSNKAPSIECLFL